MRQSGFSDPGHVFYQQMATGQQARHAVFDLCALADDDRANLVHQCRELAGHIVVVGHARHINAKA
jgi:hypothetical protein